MEILPPGGLPEHQQERWRWGIELLKELLEIGHLDSGHLAAHGRDETVWELSVYAGESGLSEIKGPKEAPLCADNEWFYFDLSLEVRTMDWSWLCGTVQHRASGCDAHIPQMRVVEGKCKPIVRGALLEVNFTVSH